MYDCSYYLIYVNMMHQWQINDFTGMSWVGVLPEYCHSILKCGDGLYSCLVVSDSGRRPLLRSECRSSECSLLFYLLVVALLTSKFGENIGQRSYLWHKNTQYFELPYGFMGI